MIKNFNNLDEYHCYIESQKNLVKDNFLPASLSMLQDRTENENLKKALTFEIYIEDFKINTSELTLSDEGITYLKERASNTQNPELKAKYNHILWQKTRNSNYAQQAVDNYIITLKNSTFNSDDNASNQAFARLFKLMFSLAQDVKYKKEEVLEYLSTLLGQNKIHGYQEYSIMNFIAAEGKKVNNALKTFFTYSNKIIDGKIYPDYIEDYIKLQLVTAQKIGESITPFHNRLAQLYLEDSEAHEGSFVAPNYYSKAMFHYRKAGNKVKVEEVSVLLEKAKKNLNLKSVPFEFSDPLLDEYFRSVENQLENL
ncbi:hypothetical protein, partial [Flavobacterium sp.]|uniref:DUF7380 domain-containing protein n=1 Tax=Flavobacterium sp. TaxID=239 RepID=UPI0025B7F74F